MQTHRVIFIFKLNNIAPSNVGPGLYGGSRFKLIKEKSPRKDVSPTVAPFVQVSQPNIFGSVDRFKGPRAENPGPGSYADVNRWHKKTYNLKFLNVA